MRPELHTLLLILVCAGVTIALRALPFLALGRGGQPPALVRRLGERLPPAVMAILVVYCLRSTSFAALSGWVPALAAGRPRWRCMYGGETPCSASPAVRCSICC